MFVIECSHSTDIGTVCFLSALTPIEIGKNVRQLDFVATDQVVLAQWCRESHLVALNCRQSWDRCGRSRIVPFGYIGGILCDDVGVILSQIHVQHSLSCLSVIGR